MRTKIERHTYHYLESDEVIAILAKHLDYPPESIRWCPIPIMDGQSDVPVPKSYEIKVEVNELKLEQPSLSR